MDPQELRRGLRSAPFWWAVLAVVVALLALMIKASSVLVIALAVLMERTLAAAVAGAAWADEYVSDRAGLPPVAAIATRRTR